MLHRVAPITQLGTCVIKIVTFKRGHLLFDFGSGELNRVTLCFETNAYPAKEKYVPCIQYYFLQSKKLLYSKNNSKAS